MDWILKPTLAEVVSNADVQHLITDDNYRAEQKVDGVRLMIHCHEGKVVGVNRRGEVTNMPVSVGWAFTSFDGEWAFDGELIKDTFWIFDMPRALDVISTQTPYSDRRELLEELWPNLEMPTSVRLLPSLTNGEAKIAAAKRVLESGGEGMMLKRCNAVYSPGKRTRNILKWKFVKDVDCFVMAVGIDGKQNFSIGVVDDETGESIEVSTVSALTGDGPKIQLGDVVTVRYLYASADNRLVQPTKPQLRPDKLPRECLLSQLSYVNKEVLI